MILILTLQNLVRGRHIFVVIILIVTTVIILSKTRDCGFLLKKTMSLNSLVSYKFVLYWFIHVAASLLKCNWLSKQRYYSAITSKAEITLAAVLNQT